MYQLYQPSYYTKAIFFLILTKELRTLITDETCYTRIKTTNKAMDTLIFAAKCKNAKSD